jgi:undecaprenyl-diphosphatase
MNFFYAIFLGLLQGATEFLPISSSGHLALVEFFLGIEEGGLAFDVALHLGTLLGVIIYFRRDFTMMFTAL